ncbi:MAG: GntR family transcriptional regulator [Proteobacteria bacterium]|nr:GntR family transcriptional regulator [Pseudomonadota bacterium]
MDPKEVAKTDSATVVATLRQLIVNGRLAAGERLAEIPVAESLGVSRTPVRLAFRALEQEGLLARAGKRGYEVRSFSEADVRTAIEVRGTLEGLAVRHLAERGMPQDVRATLRECIAEGAGILAKGHLLDDDVSRWSHLNKRFHDTLVNSHESRVIADAIARNDHLPFASADSIALDRSALPAEYEKLRIAQLQHRLVFDALEQRESARAEMLMREHAWVGFRYGPLFGAPG